MSKPTKYALFIVVITTGFLLLWQWKQRSEITENKVNRLIQKELPIGSNKEAVYEFLEHHKFMYGGYKVGPDPFIGLPDDERQWTRHIVASIQGSSITSFSDFRIFTVFYFDEQYSLTNYRTEQLDDVP